jgi:NTP pyrophosphatase (non-canonical NTP hydrolase)
MERKEFIEKCNDVQEYWRDRMPMMFMEECGEAIQAISKFERVTFDPIEDSTIREKRGAEAEKGLIDELGDMYISLMAITLQYRQMIDDFDEKLKTRIETKLNKKY